MYYNVDFDICSAIFLIFLMTFANARKKLGGLQSKMFHIYLGACFFNCVLDIITCFTDEMHEYTPVWGNWLLNGLFLVIQCAIPMLFMLYVYYKVTAIRGKKNRLPWLGCLPAMISIFFVLSSIFTHWVFYMGEKGYTHGPFYLILYFNAIGYAIGTIIYVIVVQKELGRKDAFLCVFMIVVTIIPTGLQVFLSRYMLTSLGTAVSVFIMYLTSENKAVLIDSTTGALNRDALMAEMREYRRNEKKFQLIVVALDNFKIINEMYGVEGGNELMSKFVDALKLEYKETQVYRHQGDTFAILMDAKEKHKKEIDRLQLVLSKTYLIKGNAVSLSACICVLQSENHGDSIAPAIDYAVHQAKKNGKGQIYYVDEDVIKEIQRRNAIEQAMMSIIESGHFEVHYQPIYDTAKKKFHSMEALARLQVPDYGYVSPEEFIRIAEQNGSIIQIGMLVLEEVCRFISENDLSSLGVEFVEVNLSVVQCMRDKLYAELKDIMDKYHVPYHMINLEITESAAVQSEEKILNNMQLMREMDITFSLDDYGSGYSNINYIVDMPFSIVKIDKYFVWAAMKEEASHKILEHTLAMFKDINLKIVAEGIEDLDMANDVTSLGADYLQGYYYSKPLPKDKLLVFLQDKANI